MDLKRDLEANLVMRFRQGLRATQAFNDSEIAELLFMVTNKTVKRKGILETVTRHEDRNR